MLPLDSPTQLPRLVREEAQAGDLVVCLGAGDITTWAYALPGQLEALARPRLNELARRPAGGARAGCCATPSWRPSPGSAWAGRRTLLFLPEDEDDLSASSRRWTRRVPVTPIGVGSNLLVRDGGVEGVVIRLGRGFGQVEPQATATRSAPAPAVLDAMLAKKAAEAGIAGLEFYRGVPGTIGGACVMNAGCYGVGDQGRAGRGLRAGPQRRARSMLSNARDGLHLPPLRRGGASGG